MGPLTERFEMRLDAETVSRIDAWRSTQHDRPARSEAIRRLVDEGLARAPQGEELKLDKPQALMVWMLASILKNTPGFDDPRTAELIQEAVYGGHHWALDWELNGVLHGHRDRREAVSKVVDIMDMWSFIEEAVARFTPEERERLVQEVGPWAKDPKFDGFDGNNEGEFRSIALFLIEKMNRFQKFKGRSLNSHSPRVASHSSMARAFQSMRANLDGRAGLTLKQIVELLKRD